MCAMPLVITANNSELVMRDYVGPDNERRFGLAHKDVGGHRERFGTAGVHQMLHDSGDQTHASLQDPEVIQHGKKRRQKQDRRQRLEGEREKIVFAERLMHAPRICQIAEHEFRALVRAIDERLDDVPGPFDCLIDRVLAAADRDLAMQH